MTSPSSPSAYHATSLGGRFRPGVAVSVGARLVLVACDHTIKVYATTSGDVVRVLRGHGDNVNGVVLLEDEVYSCGDDSTLRRWDLRAGTQISSIPLPGPAQALVRLGRRLLVLVGGRLLVYSLRQAPPLLPLPSSSFLLPLTPLSKEVLLPGEVASLPGARLLSAGEGVDVVALASEREGVLLRLEEGEEGHGQVLLRVTHSRTITALAACASPPQLALGDESGELRLATPPPSSGAHLERWHQGSVGAILFAASGAQLHSLGREGALLLQHVGGARREVVARLAPAAIAHAAPSPDGQHYALLTKDNAVRVLDVGQRRITATLYGLAPPPRQAPALVLPLSSGHLLLSTGTGVMQEWDVRADRARHTLRVLPREQTSSAARARSRTPTTPPPSLRAGVVAGEGTVVLAVQDPLGCALHVHTRHEEGWRLEARLEAVHAQPLVALAAARTMPLVASCSAEEVRLWAPLEGTWRPRATLRPDASEGGVLALALSADGSLLALAHSAHIALWSLPPDGQGARLRARLELPWAERPRGLLLSQGAQLLVWGRAHLTCWSLLASPPTPTCSLALPVLDVAPLTRNHLVLLTPAALLRIRLTPGRPPLVEQGALGGPELRQVVVVEQGDLVLLGPQRLRLHSTRPWASSAPSLDATPSAYAALYAEGGRLTALAPPPVSEEAPPQGALASSLAGAAHILPPPSLLGPTVFAALLARAPALPEAVPPPPPSLEGAPDRMDLEPVPPPERRLRFDYAALTTGLARLSLAPLAPAAPPTLPSEETHTPKRKRGSVQPEEAASPSQSQSQKKGRKEEPMEVEGEEEVDVEKAPRRSGRRKSEEAPSQPEDKTDKGKRKRVRGAE